MEKTWSRPQWNTPSWFIAQMKRTWFYERLFFKVNQNYFYGLHEVGQ